MKQLINKVIQWADDKGILENGTTQKRFAALCLFAPCTRLQFKDKFNGANSTKPLLGVVRV